MTPIHAPPFHVALFGGSQGQPLTVPFDTVVERLAQLPRLYCEPDGSFVWVGASAEPWQIDGQLHDQGAVLASVELRGQAPWENLAQLLRLLDWPASSLLVHWPAVGEWSTVEQFRDQVGQI